MASRFIGNGLPGGRNALDVPVAALAGLSVAFVTFAAPADLLADLVGNSGIASVFPAAEPPLGLRARVGIGAAGAVLVFTIAFLLLRWLDRFGSNRAARAIEEEPDYDTPRLRRRDFHPDAPPRPPLSAATELGEPLADDTLELELDAESGSSPVACDIAPEAPAPAPAWLPEPPAHACSQPVAAPAGSSLAELLDRLEQGLARRRAEAAAPSPPPPPSLRQSPPAPQVFPEPVPDRLQSAINSLQRLAARED